MRIIQPCFWWCCVGYAYLATGTFKKDFSSQNGLVLFTWEEQLLACFHRVWIGGAELWCSYFTTDDLMGSDSCNRRGGGGKERLK